MKYLMKFVKKISFDLKFEQKEKDYYQQLRSKKEI
jgi:hypothetical protein